MIVPPIKCQGIKTKLVEWIASKVPKSYDIWYEPFMGSGVVGFNIKPKRAVFSDTNPHIIQFYKDIQNGIVTGAKVRGYLYKQGELLATQGEDYYKQVRERFNSEPNSFDFLFLNRSCFNGLMRFNKTGKFNVPFCHKPARFSKTYITKIVNQVKAVSDIILTNDYDFRCVSFEKTVSLAAANDLIYCDPPYIERYSDYYSSWSEEAENFLAAMLNNTQAKFILSTWHHNEYRKNTYIAANYDKFVFDTQEHYYHVGASETNRHTMLECLVCNYDSNTMETQPLEIVRKKVFMSMAQISFFDLFSPISTDGKV